VGWIRGGERISFNRPSTWFVLGVRGEGKSSLLEHLAELHLKGGHAVLDLFGSRDGEGLAWLRSPYAQEKILLLHGDNADVTAPVDTKPVGKVRLSDFEDYDIVISSSPLYSSPSDEFTQVARLTDLLYKRLSWKRLIFCITREAANLYYSRLRVAENQINAKAEMTYLIREARHMGIAMGLDTLKFTSIDLDIRSVIDYMIMKSQGVTGLPDDLSFLYGFIEPHVFRKMPPGNFVLMTRTGSIGLEAFPELPWHKQERENILRVLGITVEHGEDLKYGEEKGTFKTIGDEEHVELVKLYLNEKLSMDKIHKLKDRSPATVKNQLDKHNEAIKRVGFCSVCKRAGGQYFKDTATRPL
jgi:hypothetical protein